MVTNGEQLVVDNRTIVILSDPQSRKTIEAFGRKAAQIDKLDALLFDAGEGAEPLRLEKQELHALEMPDPEPRAEEVSVSERIAVLRIVTSSFSESYVWRFSDGGEKPFSARMDDPDFSNDVIRGDVSLRQ